MEQRYVYVARTGVPYEGYTAERYYARLSKALADIRDRISWLGRDVPDFSYKENLWSWEWDNELIWFEVKKEEIL